MGGSYFMTSNTQPEADTSRAKQQNTVWSVDGAEKSSALPNETYLKVEKRSADWMQLSTLRKSKKESENENSEQVQSLKFVTIW